MIDGVLVAGQDQDLEHVRVLELGQPLAVDLAVDQPRDEVVLGVPAALLAEGAFLPVASLRARVPGLAPARAKTVAAELVASGEARVVLRTSKETLVPARARVLDASEIRALGRALSDLAKTCATASRKKATNPRAWPRRSTPRTSRAA